MVALDQAQTRMVGSAGKYALVALLVGGAAVTASKLDDWSHARAPALIDLAVPQKKQAVSSSTRDPRETAAPPVPQLELDHLSKRSARAAPGDLFQSRDWVEPKEKPRAVVPVQASAPQLPPLPYTYLGKWTEGKQEAVVLSREGRSYVAHVDDVLDGAYRVDRIEPTRVTLTFLPLDGQQVLDFKAASRPDATGNSAANTLANPDAILHVVLPPQAAVAEEFTILLSLDPVQTALIARGTIELSYDPMVLNVIAAGATRLLPSHADPGRISVELGGGYVGHGGPAAAVRLRVVTDTPTTTQLRLATVAATDLEEHSLSVAVDGPNPHPLAIVGAGKTK